MPYIKKEKRPALDIIVDNMVKNVIVADGGSKLYFIQICKISYKTWI